MKRKSVNVGGVMAAAGALLSLSAPAFAQIPPPRFVPAPAMGAQSAKGATGAPPVARYVVEGNISFTLDTSGPLPLMRYSNSNEVFALRPQPAPRGDTVFVNDNGETVLRATRLGGLTAFTSTRPEGAAAALTGSAPSLGLPDIRNSAQMFLRMYQSADRISHMIGKEIGFEANDISGPEVLPLVADSVNVTVEAFGKVTSPSYRKKKTWVSNLGVVKIIEGEPPQAYVQNDALVLVISPRRGVAGRPSSLRIVKALTR